MLNRGIADIEFALLHGKQNRGAVPKILYVISDVIFLGGIRQGCTKCTEAADLDAVTHGIGGAGWSTKQASECGASGEAARCQRKCSTRNCCDCHGKLLRGLSVGYQPSS